MTVKYTKRYINDENEIHPRVRRTLYLSYDVLYLLKKEAKERKVSLSDNINTILKRNTKWKEKRVSEKLKQVEVKLAFSVIKDQESESKVYERTYSNQIAGILRGYTFRRKHT